MIVPLTVNNLVCSADLPKLERVVNVSRELGEKVACCPLYFAWRYIEADDDFALIPLLDDNTLRNRRQTECFDRIDNKSVLWWNSLSDEDEAEVKQWYNDWLNVTSTKVIPELPTIFRQKE